MPLDNCELPETEEAIFECQISKKNIAVKWLHNGKEVKMDGTRVQAIMDGFIHQLVIKDCTLDDSGDYKCVMANYDAETAAKLIVEGEFFYPITHTLTS